MVRISHTVKRITVNGVDVIEKFLKSLEKRDKEKVLTKLKLLYKYGLKLKPPVIVPLQSHNLWELRIDHRRNQYRILFFEYGDYLVLLNGFQYKDEYPLKEIETALARKDDLLDK